MIVFSRTQLTAMREQAETTYPEECCGLIAGWVDGDTIRATEVEPSPNVAPAIGGPASRSIRKSGSI